MNTSIRDLLNIPDFAPDFQEVVVTDPNHLFKDTECEECDHPAAVYIEYTVLDDDEGFIATDAILCLSHAESAVRCVLERTDRSIDHGTTVSVNYWAIRYGFERVA